MMRYGEHEIMAHNEERWCRRGIVVDRLALSGCMESCDAKEWRARRREREWKRVLQAECACLGACACNAGVCVSLLRARMHMCMWQVFMRVCMPGHVPVQIHRVPRFRQRCLQQRGKRELIRFARRDKCNEGAWGQVWANSFLPGPPDVITRHVCV